MADKVTKLTDLVDPEVVSDMVSAKLEKSLSAIPYAKLDTKLQGRPGSSVTVARFVWDGEAEEVAEGEEIPIRQLGSETADYTIKKFGIGGSITDEAILCGNGDPVGAATTGVVNSLKQKLDAVAMTDILTAKQIYAGTTAINYDDIVSAIGVLNEEGNSEKVMFIAPEQATILRKDDNFIDRSKYGGEVMVDGEIGMIGGARIVVRKRTPKIGGYFYSPIIKLSDPDNVDDLEALTYFIKRDVNVETERLAKKRTTEITGDLIGIVAMTNESKVVLYKSTGAPLNALKLTDTDDDTKYTYPGTSVVLTPSACTAVASKTGANAYNLKFTGVATKISSANRAALGFAEGCTHNITFMVEIPGIGLSFDKSGVTWNSSAIPAGEIRKVGDTWYIESVLGIKDESGAVVLASGATTFTVGYGGTTTTFTPDFSGVTLEA